VTAPPVYWEERARRFSGRGAGLQAVCSYGMPGFYNRAIDLSQRLALARWLRVPPGSEVLDVGCGVGRWSQLLARRGAQVTGVDLSPTMLEEARRRMDQEGLGSRCCFREGDIAELDLGRRFPLVLGVTVLQHVVDPLRFEEAVARLARHLSPGGRIVLLEAAPTRQRSVHDSSIFRARAASDYVGAFARAGLRVVAITGVDPLPLKIRFLAHLGRMPRPVGLTLLAALTALSLPVEILAGRAWVSSSWHKVFVLEPGTPCTD
jgi:2-polyprenyl-3-methyl-5-hydroxy-6-metoxy-1,4-benzoquinol methylase